MKRWTSLTVALSAGALLALSVVTVVGVSAGGATTSGSWLFPNGNLANTRVANSTIDLANIATLKEVWSYKLTGKAKKIVKHLGTLASNPIIVNGLVYVQDLHSNVYAISLTTGKTVWSYVINKPVVSGPGPNGVAVANGRVYGASPREVFALNASTGQLEWKNANVLKTGQGTFGIQPTVSGGRVFIASQYGHVPGGGVLLALNEMTGKKIWEFKTVPKSSPGVASLGLGAGGAWETPLVGTDGSVSFGLGNPYQTEGSATSTPSKILYTDSIVNLDAATGKLRWYYQALPNDFKDYDLQASPIAATVNGKPVVIGGGKMGIVYEMSATTGKLLWKTPVGKHNGDDNQSANFLKGAKAPSLPFSYEPGALGGILSNMSEADGMIYVATGNVPFTFTQGSQVNGNANLGKATGTIEALNAATGHVMWSTPIKSFPMGGTTVSNNLVFTTTVKGELYAFNRSTGKQVLALAMPATTIAPPAIVGNMIVFDSGGPETAIGKTVTPQIEAYEVPTRKAKAAS